MNVIPDERLPSEPHGWSGQDLCRPECVLTHRSGVLLVPNWSGNGGISLIGPEGSTRHLISRFDKALRPNGIALEEAGSVLLAHLGDEDGGIYRLFPDGSVEAVVLTADGAPMPPANFVVKDSRDRLWITVSTRLTPRSADYRANASSGFIAVAEPGATDARIVADGLGYTNECVIDERCSRVWVNETFARRLTCFDLQEDDGVRLSNPECIHEFGPGSYPDGLALDEAGWLWITSIVSNRILRISPDGLCQTLYEDSDEAHLEWTEAAYSRDALGRQHLDKAAGRIMKNISNLAFGGADRKRIHVGNLLGSRLPWFDTDHTGVAMPHWDVDLGDLSGLLEKA